MPTTPPTFTSETKGRILLAEDEATNRLILSALLRSMGYEVDEMENGQLAWDQLQKVRDYALILTDRNMPQMDGIELSRNIKKDKRLNHIPIIMQTSAAAQSDITAGVQSGVYYYLTKPYEQETLLTLVRAALRDRQQSEAFEERHMRQHDAMGTFVKGEFYIRTLKEAENIAFLLGSLFPRPELAVMGLYELLLNAIEHGNLGIGYDEKARLLLSMQWESEIERRLALSENAAKKVIVQFAQNEKQCEITITDSGNGFDWRSFLEIEPSRATQGNGRGIAKANLLSFNKLSYQGKGNQVYIVSYFKG